LFEKKYFEKKIEVKNPVYRVCLPKFEVWEEIETEQTVHKPKYSKRDPKTVCRSYNEQFSKIIKMMCGIYFKGNAKIHN
jgi:hypothetical protein